MHRLASTSGGVNDGKDEVEDYDEVIGTFFPTSMTTEWIAIFQRLHSYSIRTKVEKKLLCGFLPCSQVCK